MYVGHFYAPNNSEFMFFKSRSIIIVGFLILCNNTSSLTLDNTEESDYCEQRKGLKSVIGSWALEQICISKECTTTESTSLKKEPNTTEDPETTTMTGREIVHVDFEVFGKVQGVFFRKNTVEQAEKLKLKGWCMNTPSGTVKGTMEGDASKIREMKHWLSNIGSKMSRIEKAEFKNEKSISTFTFTNFSVRH